MVFIKCWDKFLLRKPWALNGYILENCCYIKQAEIDKESFK